MVILLTVIFLAEWDVAAKTLRKVWGCCPNYGCLGSLNAGFEI
jgi:hypothetical protein